MTTMVNSMCPQKDTIESKGEGKMAFDANTYYNNYKREHYKRIPVEVDKDFYAEALAPAAKEKGMGVATYIKEAIKEKIERESKSKRKE